MSTALILTIEARGEIVSSNFPAFAEMVRARLGEINRELKTDEDFDQADADAKAIAGAEADLKAAKAKALADAEQLQSLFESIDGLSGELAAARLDLSKQVAKRKEEAKADLVNEAANMIDCATRLRGLFRPSLQEAVKGKRTLDSMQKALAATVMVHNALIQKSRSLIAEFVLGYGAELVMDSEDLELQSPESVEAELRRRFEAAAALEERKKLLVEMDKLKVEAKPLSEQERRGPKIESLPTGPSAKAEWIAFKGGVIAAFTGIKELRGRLQHDENIELAAWFAGEIGIIWKALKEMEEAK